MDNFNLITDPWIECLTLNGTTEKISAKAALVRAHEIRSLVASSPMDRLGILRFLLALLYWSKGNPSPEPPQVPAVRLPEEWFARLGDEAESFNLLGPGHRFFQYRTDDDQWLSANYLVHEVPTGTNLVHFRHAADGVDGLCLPCCALGLLRLPLFSTSGGRGKPPGINQKPPIYVVPLGETLAETLVLSWLPVRSLGSPAWERQDPTFQSSGGVPLLAGLTWLPRRVWLGDPEQDEANCIACGRPGRVVRAAVFAGLGSSRAGGDIGRQWKDPHVLYEAHATDPTPVHARSALASAGARAGQWAPLAAGLFRRTDGLGSSRAGRWWVVGFATVQNDKYLEATDEIFVLPDQAASSEAVVSALDAWETAQAGIAKRLRPARGGSTRRNSEITAALAAIRPDIEAGMSRQSEVLFTTDESGWLTAAAQYRQKMAGVARSISAGRTVAAVARRRRIASALPEVGPFGDKEERGQVRARKRKGGAK